jgi:DNA polymerase-3 subunit alpha
MEPILEETYGIIVYQDQVLKLVQALAGFSLGKADVLRRAMGKKDVAAMSKMNSEFMEGAAALGVDRNVAEKVWLLLLPFAGYAFNKAHAVCYSLLAYQTAYLKANYPVEYMAALLSVYLGREDKVVAFIEECRRLKIPVLPPDINHSEMDFSIEEPSESSVGAKVRKEATAIRFGLLAIKGVGEGIVEAIVKDRKVNGPYVHLYEFCERLKPTGLNRTALESLIRAGAFDRMHGNRTTVLKVLEGALQFAEVANRDRLAGQVSLFGEGHQSPMSAYPELPVVTEPSRSELLSMEKEVMGIYVSDHPLRGMESLIRSSATHTCQAAFELEEGESVKLAGVLAGVRTMVTKKTGEKMATLILEDFTGQFGLIVFPATFAKLKDSIHKDQVVQIQGVIMHRERAGEKSVELRVEQLKPLDPTLDFQLATSTDSPGAIVIELHRATEAQIVKIKELIDRHPGDYEVMLQVLPYTDFAPIPLPAMVQPDVNLLKAIEQVTKAKVELREYSPARFAGAVVQAS